MTGHFVLKTSANLKAAGKSTPEGRGDHSPKYIAKDEAGTFGVETDRLGLMIAMQIWDTGLKPTVIACPAIGAIQLMVAVWRPLELLVGQDQTSLC